MKKYLISIIFLIPYISLSNLFCDVNHIKDNKYSEKLSYLKIENDDIYKAYLLVKENGEILISDNEKEVLPLASLTKLMTAMIVLDNIKDVNKYTTIDNKEAKIPYGVRLKPNSKYKIKDLMYFMLMMSSNSSAKALANEVSDDFVDLMNIKARKIGAKTASFCTPHGLPPKYTNTCLDVASAEDVYKISKYAIENYPLISEITSTAYKIVDNKKLINTNELLRIMEGVKGIKTGYHKIAGYNISILYENNGNRLYEVILGSDTEKNRKIISQKILNEF